MIKYAAINAETDPMKHLEKTCLTINIATLLNMAHHLTTNTCII